MRINNKAEMQAVATIGLTISLLVAIAVGILVYWSFAETGEFAVQTEEFTGLTSTADITKTLRYPPASASDFSGTWSNASSSTNTALTTALYTLSDNTLVLKTNTGTPTGDAENMTSVNITYYTETGVLMENNINPTSQTIFILFPIIAVVLIAGAILIIVTRFGGSNI